MNCFYRYPLSILLIIASSWNYAAAQQSGCVSSINQIVVAEALVKDTSVVREYVMCAKLAYSVQKLDFYNNLVDGGQSMIPLRPNIHLKCGADGQRTSNCIVNAGDVLIDGTSYWDISDPTIENVIIEGFTFVQAGKYVAELNKPGSVTFRDCVFKDAVNATAAVLADYYSASNTTGELTVSFQKCEFSNNVNNPNGGQSALVVGNSRQNRLIFNECRFAGNDMTFNNSNIATNSFLVESSGPLEMVNNCFDANLVGVAPAGVYSDQFLAAGNYGNGTVGGICAFAATFTDPQRFELNAPYCTQYDVTACGISATYAPIAPPSGSPVTESPTFPATESPTSSTQAPTHKPTKKPVSAKPTRKPTSSPSAIQTTGSVNSAGYILSSGGVFITMATVMSLLLGSLY